MKLVWYAVYVIGVLWMAYASIPDTTTYTCTVMNIESSMETAYYTNQKYKLDGLCKFISTDKSEEYYHACMNDEGLLRSLGVGYRYKKHTSHIYIHEKNMNITKDDKMKLNCEYKCYLDGSCYKEDFMVVLCIILVVVLGMPLSIIWITKQEKKKLKSKHTTSPILIKPDIRECAEEQR